MIVTKEVHLFSQMESWLWLWGWITLMHHSDTHVWIISLASTHTHTHNLKNKIKLSTLWYRHGTLWPNTQGECFEVSSAPERNNDATVQPEGLLLNPPQLPLSETPGPPAPRTVSLIPTLWRNLEKTRTHPLRFVGYVSLQNWSVSAP